MKVFPILALVVIVTGQPRRNRVQHGNGYNRDQELRAFFREVLLEGIEENIEEVYSWTKDIDEQYRHWQERLSDLEWNYETNITDENAQKSTEENVAYESWAHNMVKQARKYKKFLSKYRDQDPDLARKIRLYAAYSSPSKSADVKRMKDIANELSGIYAKASVTDDSGHVYDIEPELTKIMAESRKPDELLWAWKGWRDATGPAMKSLYEEFVMLLNKGAHENNYTDKGAAWRDSQFDGTPDLEIMCEQLWLEVKPLYQKLHAYVRQKLRQKYPGVINSPTDAIPAHLLGNMWAQEWDNIYDIVKPYPDIEEGDVSDSMRQKNYDADKMFHLAEDFYTSLGLDGMTDDFWENSMTVKPSNRDVVCHASASDFYTDKRFRIKMCTSVTEDDLETIHHEMGHIEYFMAYKNQPCIYRDGANCAFHEAIGDTIALSVRTDKHLKAIGLLSEDRRRSQDEQHKRDINYLMKKALFKIAFLPFGYLIDKWRWDVFRGKITSQTYNKEWWNLRLKYQGVTPPVGRGKDDFDPGAKYHIPANSPYICYFISFISQFQFYEALCRASGHEGPLHRCDYYNSREAGEKLKNMLKLGKSKPWGEAMKVLTGQEHIRTDAINTYFRPLIDWLDDQHLDVGWDDTLTEDVV